MDDPWVHLLRSNCSRRLLTKAITSRRQLKIMASTGGTDDDDDHDHRHHSPPHYGSIRQKPSSHHPHHQSHGGTTPTVKHHSSSSSSSSLSTSPYLAGLTAAVSATVQSVPSSGSSHHSFAPSTLASEPTEEQISSLFMQQMIQNSKQLQMLGLDGTGALEPDRYTHTEPITATQPLEHIFQSHSESARNAIIYVAVILSIYLMAVAFIAIQYYRKHSTLDPFSAYILRRNKGNPELRGHLGPVARAKRRKSQSGMGLITTDKASGSSAQPENLFSSSSSVSGNGTTGGGGGTGNGSQEQSPTTNGQPCGSSHRLVSVQINIEQVDSADWSHLEVLTNDNSKEEEDTSKPEDDFMYDEDDDDLEEDHEVDDEYEVDTSDEIIDIERQRIQPSPPPPISRKQRLKNLFTFGSNTPPLDQPLTTAVQFQHSLDNRPPTPPPSHTSIKFLMRSLSLQSGDSPQPQSPLPVMSSSPEHPANNSSPGKPTDTDIRMFKRSCSSGFTTTVFKKSSVVNGVNGKYEETHL